VTAFRDVGDLIDALVDQLPAQLPGVTVADGHDLSATGVVLEVGVQNPLTAGSEQAAAGTVDWATTSARRLEDSGEIWLAAWHWTGDPSPRAARGDVFAVRRAVVDWVRSLQVPFLGLQGLFQLLPGTTYTFDQTHSSDGSVAVVAFALTYKARV